MKRRFFLFFLLFSVSIQIAQSETPRWLMTPAISPDGSTIAFSYKGEIFTVASTGGKAFQITSNPAYDSNPVWSPDGNSIVFLSDREGSDDLYITSSQGGTPKRLTTHSGNETPLTFINDSILLFNASLLPGEKTARAPFFSQIYSINVKNDSPRPVLFLSFPVLSADANREGSLLFQNKKGYEDPLRKHERSAGTSDIWLYEKGIFKQLTSFDGSDQSPVWGSGNQFYYLSEKDGTFNVFAAEIGSESEKQLTTFTKFPVRNLSSSDNEMLAFSWDGEIYTLNPGQSPLKVDISIDADLYDGDLVKRYVSSGASAIDVAPKGKEVALIIRGDLYVTNSKYKTTKRITDTPDQERSMSFSPDGRSIVFDSDKDGIWQLFIAKIKNPEEKEFAYATDIIIEPLYKCETSAMQPAFSPDGKKVAFLEDRSAIKVIDLDSKKVTTALDGKYNYSYSDGDIDFDWSPDGQWILSNYMGPRGWNNADIAISKADGTQTVNLTESGYNDYMQKWALDGKAVVFATSKYGMKAHGSWGNQDDILIMVLDGDAWDKFNFTSEEDDLYQKAKAEEEKDQDNKKEKQSIKSKEDKNEKNDSKLDLDNRKYRIKRLTSTSSSILDFILSPTGDKLYFIAEGPDGSYFLFSTDLKKATTDVLAKDMLGSFASDRSGENVFIICVDGIKKLSLADGEIEEVEFEAPYDRHPSLERQYIFDHMAKQVEDKFYDKNLHGTDWKFYTDHYREFLPYISNNRDFAILLSETLGELNASHTGGRYRPVSNIMPTAFLGAYFDQHYEGNGLKISEILPTGPLANKSSQVFPGDIITTIDNTEIQSGKDYYPLLQGKAGKKVRLGITQKDGTKKHITIRPLSQDDMNQLSYQRWVENNEKYVDSISGGKIAYVHVRGMDTSSFQEVYDRLLGKYRNHEAVVVDTRYNGGGWLHNDLVLLLNGKQYMTYSPRGEEIGIEPFSQWTKPSVMLVNESNYSDAHGTPFAYHTLGIGEIIGAPVPGTMTAVWWENQIDPTLVFGIPQVTNVANDGTILENTQLNPDIIIYNLPGDIENGKDAQLEGAVYRLLETIKK